MKPLIWGISSNHNQNLSTYTKAYFQGIRITIHVFYASIVTLWHNNDKEFKYANVGYLDCGCSFFKFPNTREIKHTPPPFISQKGVAGRSSEEESYKSCMVQ